MKKSFTLIEVMVATIIVLSATFAILSLSGNSKHLFNLISKNNSFSLKATILVSSDKNRTNLYENLIDFNITNDEIIKSLKKEKIDLKISLDSKNSIDEFQLNEQIKTIEIYNQKNRVILYSLELK